MKFSVPTRFMNLNDYATELAQHLLQRWNMKGNYYSFVGVEDISKLRSFASRGKIIIYKENDKLFIIMHPCGLTEIWANTDDSVDYRSIFKRYAKEIFFDADIEKDINGYHIDHVFSRARCKSIGINFALLMPIDRTINIRWGAHIEKILASFYGTAGGMRLIQPLSACKLLGAPPPKIGLGNTAEAIARYVVDEIIKREGLTEDSSDALYNNLADYTGRLKLNWAIYHMSRKSNISIDNLHSDLSEFVKSYPVGSDPSYEEIARMVAAKHGIRWTYGSFNDRAAG